jgi:hypothetical protein
MIGTAINAIRKSRMILSVTKEPVMSGSGKRMVTAPNRTEGQ